MHLLPWMLRFSDDYLHARKMSGDDAVLGFYVFSFTLLVVVYPLLSVVCTACVGWLGVDWVFWFLKTSGTEALRHPAQPAADSATAAH